MRAAMAFFAGAGTVVVALAAGLGGGVLVAGIMNPHGTREASTLEQRHAPPEPSPQSSQTTAAANGSQAPAPYLAATQQAAPTPVVVSPAPSSSPRPRNAATSDVASKPAEPSTPAVQGSAPENAFAKAPDAGLKRSGDKRKADRAERRRQWAARRQQQREGQREADAQVREDIGPGRNIVRRSDSWRDNPWRDESDRPTRMEFPRINLFGQD